MRILIAVDGSGAALAAAQFVRKLIQSGLRATPMLAHVEEPTYLVEVLSSPPPGVLGRFSGATAESVLEPAASLFRGAGIPIETHPLRGEPVAALIDATERLRVDLLVVGARGLGAVKSALLGSVSQAVIQRAGVPVTVVRMPG